MLNLLKYIVILFLFEYYYTIFLLISWAPIKVGRWYVCKNIYYELYLRYFNVSEVLMKKRNSRKILTHFDNLNVDVLGFILAKYL